MKGSIRQRGKDPQSWTLIVDAGKDSNGKRVQRWYSFHGTKREAETELAKKVVELDSGSAVEPNRLTVGEYLKKWLADYATTNVAPTTLQRYESIINRHMVPAIGGLKLSKLSPLHIQAMYRTQLQGSRLDAKQGTLSPTTVLQHHRILKEALGQAVRWRLLPVNPAGAVEPPRRQTHEMKTLTSVEAGLLLGAAAGNHLEIPVMLALMTGLRKGEILALQWKDVDLETGTMQVRRSAEFVKGGVRFKEPKTSHGRRVVALPAVAVQALRHHRVAQAEWRLKFGPDYTDLDLVCCLPDGRAVRNNLIRDFSALLKRAGLPRVRFHDLRHTHATFLLGQGVHPKIVSERLGHANISITLDTYSHVLPDMQREAASKIDGIFGVEMATRATSR